MSNYIESNLQKNEKILARAEFSYLKSMPWIILWLIFVAFGWIFYAVLKNISEQNFIWFPILMMIIGFIPFIFSIMEIKNTELAVTNRRIIGKRGIFGLKTTEILINKVDTVKIQATFFGRLCNYYSVEFVGSGKGTDQIVATSGGVVVVKDNLFNGVKNANKIKNSVNVALEVYADEARKSQASDIAEALKN